MKKIKRSELYKMGEKLDLLDPNDYIMQVRRTHPDLEIIDDILHDIEPE